MNLKKKLSLPLFLHKLKIKLLESEDELTFFWQSKLQLILTLSFMCFFTIGIFKYGCAFKLVLCFCVYIVCMYMYVYIGCMHLYIYLVLCVYIYTYTYIYCNVTIQCNNYSLNRQNLLFFCFNLLKSIIYLLSKRKFDINKMRDFISSQKSYQENGQW